MHTTRRRPLPRTILFLMVFCACGAAGLFSWAAQQKPAAAPKIPETIIYEENVEYGKGGDVPLTLDIARPSPKQGDGPFPAIVCIHGGGWRGGDKAGFRGLILGLAQQGYVAITVKYRFAPAHPFPAQIEDVKCAVRYLRANAKELKVDPDRIGALGGSAGGHLALMLGTTEQDDGLEGKGGHEKFSSEVQAVGSLVGPTDLRVEFPVAVEAMLKDLAAGTRKEKTEVYKQASPLAHLSKDDPPIFGIYGTKDELVPYTQATLLTDACKEKGVKVEVITIQDGGHGSGGKPADWHAANLKMLEFFNQQLKKSTKP